jgi:hypothetical protein
VGPGGFSGQADFWYVSYGDGGFAAQPFGPTRWDTTGESRPYAGVVRDRGVDLDVMGLRAFAPTSALGRARTPRGARLARAWPERRCRVLRLRVGSTQKKRFPKHRRSRLDPVRTSCRSAFGRSKRPGWRSCKRFLGVSTPPERNQVRFFSVSTRSTTRSMTFFYGPDPKAHLGGGTFLGVVTPAMVVTFRCARV